MLWGVVHVYAAVCAQAAHARCIKSDACTRDTLGNECVALCRQLVQDLVECCVVGALNIVRNLYLHKDVSGVKSADERTLDASVQEMGSSITTCVFTHWLLQRVDCRL